MTHRRTVETTFRVRYAETDQSGAVYNANYLVWFEVARGEFFWQRGGDYAQMFEARGLYLVISEAHLRYLAPARYGDRVTIRAWVSEIKSRGLTVEYLVANAETQAKLCEGWTRAVCIDRAGRATRLPDDLRAFFE
jgi:acyl-CoA thioester hydrolase